MARGRRLAGELGCFNCHGAGGRGGVPNPGSKTDDVPSFHEGHADDVRRQRRRPARVHPRRRAGGQAPARIVPARRSPAQAIHMPAFRGWISERDVDALVAYLRAASELLEPEDETIGRGGELARANGCFGCHGEMGSGGHANPGSFKGYIPGFSGPGLHRAGARRRGAARLDRRRRHPAPARGSVRVVLPRAPAHPDAALSKVPRKSRRDRRRSPPTFAGWRKARGGRCRSATSSVAPVVDACRDDDAPTARLVCRSG